MRPLQINGTESTIEANSISTDQIEARQILLNPGMTALSFGVITEDGDWHALNDQGVPPGISENILLQLVARQLATEGVAGGETACMTFNGMLISNTDSLSITPADPMSALQLRLNTPGASDWLFRVVINPVPDPVTGWRNARIEVKGEAGKKIAWAIAVTVAIAQES